MTDSLIERLNLVRERIVQAAEAAGRSPSEIQLLAVSKTRAAGEIQAAFGAGQRAFGESYLQEALGKQDALADLPIEWHFIGRVQSNKTRPLAERFHWVHGVDQVRQAQRLSDQRPVHLPPLNICLQVKIDDEESKGGLSPAELPEAIRAIASLPNLRLRGLMTLPAPVDGLEAQRLPFRRLRELRDRLAGVGLPLETLSMGMSDDLEAAILEGATIVRVGTSIFGPRARPTQTTDRL